MPLRSILLGICLSFLSACGTDAPSAATPTLPENDQAATLMAVRCGSCHAVADPSDLDRATWRNHVLPRMGYFLGIYPDTLERAALLEAGADRVARADIFPAEPRISGADWEAIQAYILRHAPEVLEVDTLPLAPALPLFRPRFSEAFLSPPSVTLAQFSAGGGYYIGDANQGQLFYIPPGSNQPVGALPVGEGAVCLTERNNALLVSVMGSFSPTDQARGRLLRLPLRGGGGQVLLDSLQRPVHHLLIDLNEDGREDLIVSEYGKWTGRLAWWEATADGGYQPHTLRDISGAIRTATTDLNGDGRTDILALFGQGDEGIWAFFNQGQGQFREQQLLRFPPSYGSSYFQLIDWDGDGDHDLLYTNGDNADYSPILKPYHGIRLFTNGGGGQFVETWFQPLPGAYKVLAEDFDQDGDRDLAAISFFPDFERQPRQGFVYFENLGADQFLPRGFPRATLGRWITLDAGDVDQDGDLDLLLGSLAFEVVPDRGQVKGWVDNGLGWMVLENTRR